MDIGQGLFLDCFRATLVALLGFCVIGVNGQDVADLQSPTQDLSGLFMSSNQEVMSQFLTSPSECQLPSDDAEVIFQFDTLWNLSGCNTFNGEPLSGTNTPNEFQREISFDLRFSEQGLGVIHAELSNLTAGQGLAYASGMCFIGLTLTDIYLEGKGILDVDLDVARQNQILCSQGCSNSEWMCDLTGWSASVTDSAAHLGTNGNGIFSCANYGLIGDAWSTDNATRIRNGCAFRLLVDSTFVLSDLNAWVSFGCGNQDVYPESVLMPGCLNPDACNFNEAAEVSNPASCRFEDSCGICGGDDTDCDPCVAQENSNDYPLVVEAHASPFEGFTTYRVYVTAADTLDRLYSVSNASSASLLYMISGEVYNSELNAFWNASGINPYLVSTFPDIAADSYATVNLNVAADSIELELDPEPIDGQSDILNEFFVDDSGFFQQGDSSSIGWRIPYLAKNAEPSVEGKWLIAQVTASTEVGGTMSYCVLPKGRWDLKKQITTAFEGEGTFGGEDILCGCIDTLACNYDPTAEYMNDDCLYPFSSYVDCAGECLADEDDDGICDELEVPGCINPTACNYLWYATDSAACEFPAMPFDCNGTCTSACDTVYSLTIDQLPAVNGSTFRFYVNMNSPTDRLRQVFASDYRPMLISTPDGVYNSEFNTSWSASGISAAIFQIFPDVMEDSYATIGLSIAAISSGIEAAADPSLIDDPTKDLNISQFFTQGGTQLSLMDPFGYSGWYVLDDPPNCYPDTNNRVLVLQITTSGPVSGVVNFEVIPGGTETSFKNSIPFNGAGTYFGTDPVNIVFGCTYPMACNYDPEATVDDSSCDYCFCGQGTNFNLELNQCLPSQSYDNDGCTGTEDLLILLSEFGNCSE